MNLARIPRPGARVLPAAIAAGLMVPLIAGFSAPATAQAADPVLKKNDIVFAKQSLLPFNDSIDKLDPATRVRGTASFGGQLTDSVMVASGRAP